MLVTRQVEEALKEGHCCRLVVYGGGAVIEAEGAPTHVICLSDHVDACSLAEAYPLHPVLKSTWLLMAITNVCSARSGLLACLWLHSNGHCQCAPFRALHCAGGMCGSCRKQFYMAAPIGTRLFSGD